jgi:hypothetical protein
MEANVFPLEILVLRSAERASRTMKARMQRWGASWFETRFALLTMRDRAPVADS